MEIKKFRNHYGLELISAPHEGIMLADLVWDALLGAPSFSHPGMPNTIYTAFLDAKIIDQDEFKEFQSECRETAFQEAYFPEKAIDVRSEFISELKHPSLGNLEIKVLHTPGHTPGGICLWIEDQLIVGDTLFAGSIGRTDLPGGNHHQLIKSIQNQIIPLPDETVVHPGHGPATTIGREKLYNPFLT